MKKITLLTIRILAIEGTNKLVKDIGKFTKKSKIINLDITKKSIGENDEKDDFIYFHSKNIQNQIVELNRIANEFDICIVSSWNAAKLAYLAGLKYIMFFIGNDVRISPFIKNSKPKYLTDSINKLNLFQRKFYWNIFKNATMCVTGSQELFFLLKEFRQDVMRIDRFVVNTDLFKHSNENIKDKKTKFTFFSPQRIGVEKGIDIIWDAINLTKSDFEVLQVNWIDDKTPEIEKQSLDLIKNKPKKVKMISKIEKEDMPKYYYSADAVLGEMQSGHLNYTECEAVLCNKPVLSYNDPNCKYFINDEEVSSPFQPDQQDPKKLAEIIDGIVEKEDFRNDLLEKENKFIKEIADPEKAAKDWEKIFEIQNNIWNLKQVKNSGFKKKIRMISYQIAFLDNNQEIIH